VTARRRVWYNQGLSNVFDAIRQGRAGDTAGELRFLASHTRADSAALAAADEAFEEPGPLEPEPYVDWCLEVCRARAVDLFVPARNRVAVAGRADEFAALGTRVRLLAAPAVLRLLANKADTAADLAGTPVPLPEHRRFLTADAFDEAWRELRARHPALCVKPTRGIFGAGFYLLDEGAEALALLLTDDRNRIRPADFRAAFAAAAAPPEFMLMEYLPGDEQSVDAFAHRGEVVAAVSRTKRDSSQRIETDGAAIEVARFVAARYALSGIFNLQTRRRADGTACFLEVNTRMSGGAFYAEAAGLLLPYWAVAVELGLRDPGEIPGAVPCAVAPVNAFARLRHDSA
jgi:hypothetical protein